MYRPPLVFLAVAALLALSGCGAPQEVKETPLPAIPVTASLPLIRDITVYVESIGTLQPSVLLEVRPQIEGVLLEVLAAEGQWVVPGTPLFKIEPRPYAIKVQEMEAQLAMDQADLEAIRKKMARIKPLVQKDLVSPAEWEELEAKAKRLEAALLLDEARLRSVQFDLERCTLCSPATGRLGKLDAHPGLLITKGQQDPLATISQMNPLLVEFTVTEKEFAAMAKGLSHLEIRPLGSSQQPFTPGALTFLDNHFHAKTGQLLVKGRVDNPHHALRPGQTVLVRIPIAVKEKALLVPQKAIRYNPQGPYLYVIQPDGTAALRQLILGEENGHDQVVLEGVGPSEQVILEGHLRLSPGTKVDVVSKEEGTA